MVHLIQLIESFISSVLVLHFCVFFHFVMQKKGGGGSLLAQLQPNNLNLKLATC